MRVTLFHNDDAGRSDSVSALRIDISNAGHTVIQTVNVRHDTPPALDATTELVVAAGGDGTVSGVAKLVAGTPVPLAILPMGTANNIAVSLGIAGTPAELAARWSKAKRVGFDVGVMDFATGKRVFFEGVGAGLVPAVIDSMQAEGDVDGAPHWNLLRAVQRYRDLVPRLTPRPWTIRMNDEEIEDEFLMVQVHNTTSVGPNLCFAGDASPTDGQLSLMVVREGDRALLTDFLARIHGATTDPVESPFPVMHARLIEISGQDAIHVDDTVHSSHAFGTLSLTLQESGVTVLV